MAASIRIAQAEVDRHPDCQSEDSQAPLAECRGDHEEQGRNQPDRREQKLLGRELLTAAGVGALRSRRRASSRLRQRETRMRRLRGTSAHPARRARVPSDERVGKLRAKLNEAVCFSQLWASVAGNSRRSAWRRNGVNTRTVVGSRLASPRAVTLPCRRSWVRVASSALRSPPETVGFSCAAAPRAGGASVASAHRATGNYERGAGPQRRPLDGAVSRIGKFRHAPAGA